MYIEYEKKCKIIVDQITKLNEKLSQTNKLLIDNISNKELMINNNQFSKIYFDLKRNLEKANEIKKELDKKNSLINNVEKEKNIENKNKLIEELNLKTDYNTFKENVISFTIFNNQYINNLNSKMIDIENNFEIIKDEDFSNNINEFNKKINYLNNKIKKYKNNIKKNYNDLKKLVKEINNNSYLKDSKELKKYKDYLLNNK